MNLSDEQTQRIRQSITEAHRLQRRARLEAAESECRSLKAATRDQGAELSDLTKRISTTAVRLGTVSAQIQAMLQNDRADETTAIIRVPFGPTQDGE